MRRTGFAFHEHCMWHDGGPCSVFPSSGGHVQPAGAAEHPETKRRLRNLVEMTGLVDDLVPLKGEPADEADLLRFHTRRYLEQLAEMSEQGHGEAGECAPVGRDSYAIARRSAGQAIEAMQAVLRGDCDNAYALCRPPGHHAEPDRGRGFCLLGNIPVAVMAMQARHRLGRVVVIDWDVHHGNGTQRAFWDSNEVLTLSLHHDNNYPLGSGSLEERGEGAGYGYNLNVPLPAGSGIGAYLACMERVVLPALTRFRPELIVVACGYDAAAMDPLGCMLLNSTTFGRMTQMLVEAADELCEGRLVMVHEGGYSQGYVPFCGHAVIQTLAGSTVSARDPSAEEIAQWGQQSLQPHQAALIERAAAMLESIG
ncbi:histone deacetylase-like amidohydrolase [Halomonas elongata]|uniref:Histone deacetylase-like amidohydrolase n=1 Tax=Halomonas elongata TaxID=2746 RepID=A0A1B8P385_HALEL|nr:class II histone deacetylase [Halomonas elongata]OBX36724.1 histone deacetylase-like amidohydrolase [Halomonas elongata]